MRIRLLIILAFFPIICSCQSKNHVLFGIDLDLDWYSLTDQQALGYASQNLNKEAKFVIANCDFIHDKIDSKFLDLKFNEMLLFFPTGHKGKLIELKPDLFIARKYYTSISDYYSNSPYDIDRIKKLLSEVYGNPELNMEKDKYSVYKWKGVYYQIIITCREDDLTTALIYTKE